MNELMIESLTLPQLKRLYVSGVLDNAAWDPDCASWIGDLRKEMAEIVAAKSPRAATKAIAWWGWEPGERPSMTAYCTAVRQTWTKMVEEHRAKEAI